MRATRSERLASQTSEERAARLQEMSARLRERLAFETAEERTARLQQMSANQPERLASETAEEREVRLQYYSDKHRELQVVQSQLPLLRTAFSSNKDAEVSCSHGLTRFTAVLHLLGEVPWPPASLTIY